MWRMSDPSGRYIYGRETHKDTGEIPCENEMHRTTSGLYKLWLWLWLTTLNGYDDNADMGNGRG